LKYHVPGIGIAQVGAVNDPEGETLVLSRTIHLDAAAVAQASAAALALDTHGYTVSSVYKKTPHAARSPELVHYALAVNKVGNGTVTLDPPGGVYAAGTVVQLTATPEAGFTFSGWSGAAIDVANPIMVTMDSDKAVTGTFAAVPPPNYTLTVDKVGNG